MLSNEQIELLASIQALAAAGRMHTGHNIKHTIDFMGSGATFSTVSCRLAGDTGEALHLTHATVRADGTDMAAEAPCEFLMTSECTLAKQRDKLATFIAAHRKQEAA